MYLKISLSSAITHNTRGVGNMAPIRLALGRRRNHAMHVKEWQIAFPVLWQSAFTVNDETQTADKHHCGFIRKSSEQRDTQFNALKNHTTFSYYSKWNWFDCSEDKETKTFKTLYSKHKTWFLVFFSLNSFFMSTFLWSYWSVLYFFLYMNSSVTERKIYTIMQEMHYHGY